MSEASVLTPEELALMRDGKQPESGRIMRRLREARGLRQADIASKIGTTSSTITLYETGKRWPVAGAKREHLLLILSPQTRFAVDQLADMRITQAELAGIVASMQRAGMDDIDVADSLMHASYLRVLSTLILKASGVAGIVADARTIQLYMDTRDKVMEAKRLKGASDQRNVTPIAKGWMEARLNQEVTADSATPTASTSETTTDGSATNEA